MLFRKLLPLFAVFALLCVTRAHAQIGVYGTVTGERISGLNCTQLNPIGVGNCTTGTVTEKPYGANFGGFYDFRSIGPVRLGVDLRGGVLNTNKNNANNSASSDVIRHYTALGGVRGTVGTPIKWIRPYGEVAVGYAKFGPVYHYANYTQVEGIVGVDIPILPFLDIRGIEFSAGEMFGPSSHGVQSIGAGLVFHTSR